MDGPTLNLKDITPLCSAARFCHRGGGTWKLTHHSDNPKARELAIEEACSCPSGRLVECDKETGKVIEKEFEKSISLIEDPQNKVSGKSKPSRKSFSIRVTRSSGVPAIIFLGILSLQLPLGFLGASKNIQTMAAIIPPMMGATRNIHSCRLLCHLRRQLDRYFWRDLLMYQ